jgi:hypothetical protein
MDKKDKAIVEVEAEVRLVVDRLSAMLGVMGVAWDDYDPEWWEDHANSLSDAVWEARAVLQGHLSTFSNERMVV